MLCKSHVSPKMILNLKIDAKMEQIMQNLIPNEQNGTQMTSKWSPNPPPQASKWARRPQDGSRGAKMVSTRLKELPKDSQDGRRRSQDGSFGPQHHIKRSQYGPKQTQGGLKMDLRWTQKASKRPNWLPKWNIVLKNNDVSLFL